MSVIDIGCDQTNPSTTKFELFHAPSFGDEDFEFTSSSCAASSCAISSVSNNWAGPPDDASSTSSSLTSGPNVDITGHHHPSPSPVTSVRQVDAITVRDDIEVHQNLVYNSQFSSEEGSSIRNSSCTEFMSDRKYATPLYHSPDGTTLSPSSMHCHNNNNNENLRSHPFTVPTSHSMMTLKHYDSFEYPTFEPSHQQQQQQQSSFDPTASLCHTNQRTTNDISDQRHIAVMQYGNVNAVPTGVGYNGNAAGNNCSASVPPSQIGDGGYCRSGSLINGFFPPRYEASNSTAVKKTKSTKKRKKKDSNEPQKPVSAYALFFRDTQAAIKSHNPSASFGEMSKIVAAMWDSLDDIHKNIYRKRTEMAKKTYLKQLATYRASQLTKDADDESSINQPIPSLSPVSSEVTSPPNNLVVQPPNVAAVCTANQQAAPLSHLPVDCVRQMPTHYTMTSPQRNCGPVTTRYDVYGSTMTGNGNNHILHQPSPPSSVMNAHMYQQHGVTNVSAIQSSSMMPNCNGQVLNNGFVHSPTAAVPNGGVRWNSYCSPHDVNHPQKLDCQQTQSAWWIR